MADDTSMRRDKHASPRTVAAVTVLDASGNPALPHDLAAAALDLYDPHLPYHNANHALHVTGLASRFSSAATAAGVDHDPQVVVVAALLHDAGYGHHHDAADAEAHSVALSAQLLADHGWHENRVAQVCAAIEATRLRADSECVEGRLVRAADLWEMGASWPVFAANRTLLRLEAEMLDGVTFNPDGWRVRVARIVGGYAEGPLWLPPRAGHADGGVAAWRDRVRDNLTRHAHP